MFSKTVVDIRKRDELHACTGWLTERFVPWSGLWMRDKTDDMRGVSFNELKSAWVNNIDRATIARLYDYDFMSEIMWEHQGFIKAQDHLYDANGIVSTVPVWIPEEAAEEEAQKQIKANRSAASWRLKGTPR